MSEKEKGKEVSYIRAGNGLKVAVAVAFGVSLIGMAVLSLHAMAPDAKNKDVTEAPVPGAGTAVTATEPSVESGATIDAVTTDAVSGAGEVVSEGSGTEARTITIEPVYASEIVADAPESGYFINDDGYHNNRVREQEAAFNLLPAIVRVHILSEASIHLEDSEEFGPAHGKTRFITGYSDVSPYRATIWIDPLKNVGEKRWYILHQAGHVMAYFGAERINHSIAPLYSLPDFQSLFREESQNMPSVLDTHKANYSTPAEYFATAFAMTCYKPEEMKAACQKTYEYMRQVR